MNGFFSKQFIWLRILVLFAFIFLMALLFGFELSMALILGAISVVLYVTASTLAKKA